MILNHLSSIKIFQKVIDFLYNLSIFAILKLLLYFLYLELYGVDSLVCFEIYLDHINDTIKKLRDRKSSFQYSDYQKSERDFAFIVDKKIKVQDLVNIISSVNKNLIKSVNVFDVYEGENIPENQKSIAISVTIQSSEKTLNDNDLDKINKLIIETVEKKTGAKIRS